MVDFDTARYINDAPGGDNREARQPDFGSKVLAEVYTFGGGTLQGIGDAAVKAVENPKEPLMKLAGSVAVGGAMAFASRGTGVLAPGLMRSFQLSLASSFAIDLLSHQRLGDLGQAARIAWQNPDDTSQARRLVAGSLGQIGFDTAVMTIGAAGAGFAAKQYGGRLFNQPFSQDGATNSVRNPFNDTTKTYFGDGRVDITRPYSESGFGRTTYHFDRADNLLARSHVDSFGSLVKEFKGKTGVEAWVATRPDGTTFGPSSEGPWRVGLLQHPGPSHLGKTADGTIVENVFGSLQTTQPGGVKVSYGEIMGRSYTVTELPAGMTVQDVHSLSVVQSGDAALKVTIFQEGGRTIVRYPELGKDVLKTVDGKVFEFLGSTRMPLNTFTANSYTSSALAGTQGSFPVSPIETATGLPSSVDQALARLLMPKSNVPLHALIKPVPLDFFAKPK